MSPSLLILAAGLSCAVVGGELFVRALAGFARAWSLSPAVVGALIAAIATSSPELSVAIASAIEGAPEIALGDCTGSNVVNVALILGGALLLGPLRCSRESLQRDLPVALLAPVLTGLLARDGTLSRLDGGLMLFGFAAWVVRAVRPARPSGRGAPDSPPVRLWAGWLGGLILLIVASKLIVSGAVGIATALGWTPFVVGAVIVAVGTSTPEIVTTWLSRWRGHDDIGLGTILGSNIFNLLFIVALTAVLHPIRVRGPGPWVGLGLGLAAILAVYPGKDGILGRGRGVVLLAGYVLFVGATLWTKPIGHP